MAAADLKEPPVDVRFSLREAKIVHEALAELPPRSTPADAAIVAHLIRLIGEEIGKRRPIR